MSIKSEASATASHAEAEPVDLAIAQMLALAKVANVSFALCDDRLAVRFANPRWALWPGVRQCLDEIGIEAVVDFFRRTTPSSGKCCPLPPERSDQPR